MATLIRQLGLAIGVFYLALICTGCTDKRQKERKIPVQINRLPPQSLEAVSDVRINGQDITAFQMTVKAGGLYMTGVPFAFTKWDITADAEAPIPTFIAADEIDAFQPMGRWRPDWYGSGGLGILGPYAVMSGTVGASFVSLAQTNQPIEKKRYPAIDPKSEKTPQDPNYVYKAIVAHPTLPLMYGLRESDFIAVLKVSANGLQLLKKIPYGSSNVCCVMGAAVFQNQLFVAMRGMLRVYELSANGTLSAPLDLPSLQAVNVQASPQTIYVQHSPTFAREAGSSRAAGIYAFDTNGDSVGLLTAQPKHFAVSDDDRHLYANEDDTAVKIFRINWTNP